MEGEADEDLKELEGGIPELRENFNAIIRAHNKLRKQVGKKEYTATRFTGCKNGVPVIWEMPALLVEVTQIEEE